MKHSTTGNASHSLLSKTGSIILVFFAFSITMTCCKKEPMHEETRIHMPPPSLKTSIALDSILFNKRVLKMKLQYKQNQLSQAFHYYNNGMLKKQASYEIIPKDDNSAADTVNTNDLRGKLLRIKVKEEGTYEYEPDSKGRIVRAKFYAEGSGNLRPDKRIEYEYEPDADGNDFLIWQRSFGGAGLDVLIGNTGYDRNADGTIKSISVFEGPEMKLKGKVIMQNNATAAQVAAWHQISRNFPEPDKPWEILTMLSSRIEMAGSGAVGNEAIIDGKILVVRDAVYDSERVSGLTYSGESGGLNEAFSFSFHYSWLKR